MGNRTRYVLRDRARIQERAEARIEREMRAGKSAVEVTGIPAASVTTLDLSDTIIARTVNATELQLADARLGIPARMLEDDRELVRQQQEAA